MTQQELQNYTDLKAEAQEIRQRLDELKEEKDGLRASQITGMPRAAGGQSGGPAAAVATQIVHLEELYLRKLSDALRALQRIEEAIKTLPPRERRLIRNRYQEGLSMEATAQAIGYSLTQTRRIHELALWHLRDF